MNVGLLQLDATVGALGANVERIVRAASAAAARGAELAVTPELAVVGYPPRDLLDRPGFLREVRRANERLVASAPPHLTLVAGTVLPADGPGGLATNAALVIQGGRVVATAKKRLLPTYDVFDEARHFEPGASRTSFTLSGVRVAVTVCEDAWADDESVRGRYHDDPLAGMDASTTDLLVNLSASPFTTEKLARRPALFAGLAARRGVSVLLVNQVGGNDELVFDGRSSLFGPNGELLARAPAFAEATVVTALGAPGPIAGEPGSRAEAVHGALVAGLRGYARKCGFSRAVLGLSGGIDSALVGALAAEALGPENVLGVLMPTRYSSEGSRVDARALARNLGIATEEIDVDPLLAAYEAALGPAVARAGAARPGDVTWENVQARIRGAVLMALSNRTGALVLTTGNKSELAVGYCTLYGDMVGGLAVISDVPKMLVYDVARWVNRDGERIPASSIEKPPSAELRPGQRDDDSLPPYPLLDAILELHVEDGLGAAEITARGYPADVVSRVVALVRGAEYKRRQAAPGLIVTRKAFGPGRRMPLAQGFHE